MRETVGLAVASGAVGAGVAVLVGRRLLARPPRGRDLWDRTNFRGSTVSLTGGPTAAAGATAGAVVAAASPNVSPRAGGCVVAALAASAAAGVYDDLAGDSGTKGFSGHVSALRSGRVTSGAVKVGVISGGALLVGVSVGSGPADAVLTGALVAGTANLVNLLDLRPGRAAKATILLGTPLLATPGAPWAGAAVGTSIAVLPHDLAERTMLGDAGANTLGALLGAAVSLGLGTGPRVAVLLCVLALTAASERVSFTRVIESTPGLRELDRLGRAG